MTQPFMDEARVLLDSLGACNCVECTEDVATALSSAYQRGREDAAKIAEGNSAEFDFQKALAECRDSEHGFHSGRLAAATAIRTQRDKG